MARTTDCKLCGRPPMYYTDCDTFGCPECDAWTEKPHAGTCDGDWCEYFKPSPEKPSLYTGKVENFFRKGGPVV